MTKAAVVHRHVAVPALPHDISAGHLGQLTDAARRVPGIFRVASEDLELAYALHL